MNKVTAKGKGKTKDEKGKGKWKGQDQDCGPKAKSKGGGSRSFRYDDYYAPPSEGKNIGKGKGKSYSCDDYHAPPSKGKGKNNNASWHGDYSHYVPPRNAKSKGDYGVPAK